MGERFLVLDDAAAALDAIDPRLAERFRIANGLPGPDRADHATVAGAPAAAPSELVGPVTAPDDQPHDISMVVGEGDVRCDCSCGAWTCQVGWDGIDTMVPRIREHLASAEATSDDGIPVRSEPETPVRRAG